MLCLNLLLELLDLVVHDFELAPHLVDLVLRQGSLKALLLRLYFGSILALLRRISSISSCASIRL